MCKLGGKLKVSKGKAAKPTRIYKKARKPKNRRK